MCSAELASEPVHKSSCSQNSQLSQVNRPHIKLSPVLSDGKNKKKKDKKLLYLLKTLSFFFHTLSFNIHFNIALHRNIEPLPSTLLSRQVFSWCKVNYISVSFPFCGCCLTPSTKLNTRSGCPLYNLASNSKDFPESLAKLLGMIFLYFGTPLTCCRYLFSSSSSSFFLFQTTLSHSTCTAGQFVRLLLSLLCQYETVLPL